ncbi:MAG: DUF4270 domain-containing protein [Tannerellaceae bacterium]|nr:DUF4270 domain-containing protein [Tannerellaceae bacterium]
MIEDRILNNMSLKLRGLPQDEWNFALKAPTALLLLPEDSVKVFFEEGRINNDITSFLGHYDTDTRTCDFGNISTLLKTHIDNGEEGDLRLMVVPVKEEVEYTYYYYESIPYTAGISNYLVPSGLKLRKDEEVMKVGITSSKYK